MKKMTRILSLVLVVCTLAGMLMLPAQAASTASWSSLGISASNTIKCYLKGTSNATTYTSTTLKTKSGSVYTTDEITVRKIGQNSSGTWYAYINYPLTSTGGTKNAYIALSYLTAFTTAGTKKTATAKISTIYRRAATTVYTNSYISKGDTVYVLGTSGSYTQVLYNISTGWKMAWIKTTAANSYLSTNNDTTTTLTNALYNINVSTSKITCGFDGYVNTSGRHEGIDFKYKVGAAVYSLTDGVVTNIVTGSTGSSGLSTIAIYYASANKTVVYLHTAPLSSLKVGATVSKGQQIATESWRGVSSSSSSHTHVEVRDGRKTLAAKSVNDYTLDNSNPTSFWNSLGYKVY